MGKVFQFGSGRPPIKREEVQGGVLLHNPGELKPLACGCGGEFFSAVIRLAMNEMGQLAVGTTPLFQCAKCQIILKIPGPALAEEKDVLQGERSVGGNDNPREGLRPGIQQAT